MKKDFERGRIENVSLKRPFRFNGELIETARIEIDHINFGLNKKTGSLNAKRRSQFTITDVEKFLAMLNGEYLIAREHRKRISRFDVRIDCPIQGRFFGKEFILIFETDYDRAGEVNTITLFPGRKK